MKRICALSLQGGFTLVESMIALFFIAFIVNEMAMVTVYASRSSNLAQRITRANQHADEAVEKSRNTAYDNLADPIKYLENNLNALEDTPLELQKKEVCTANTPVANATTCVSTSLINGIFKRSRVVRPLNALASAVVALNTSNKAEIESYVEFCDPRALDCLTNPAHLSWKRTIRVVSVIAKN